MQAVRTINDTLLKRVIRLRDVDATVPGFIALGFPNCGGAVDGTHILFCAPKHRAAQFIHRKGYFSMVLQALMDQRDRFIDNYVGWSGRAHDARILRNSSLFRRMEVSTFCPQRCLMVRDIYMPLCIVRDTAYPLMPWLMRPYTGRMDPGWERFNQHLNWSHNQVECAFGWLKVRFRCLFTRLKMGEQKISEVVAACCVLNNIVEQKGEAFLPGWMAGEGWAFEQPCTATILQAHHDGGRIQEALKNMFSQAPQ